MVENVKTITLRAEWVERPEQLASEQGRTVDEVLANLLMVNPRDKQSYRP